MLSRAKVKSWQIWGCVNSIPKVPALTTVITHPATGGGGEGGFLSSTQTPSIKSRGQTDSCCCYFLSLGTSPMLQSQSPSREDGVSLSWGRSSRWVCVAPHFLKCGQIFSYHRRPYLHDHGPAPTSRDCRNPKRCISIPTFASVGATGAFWVMLPFPKPRDGPVPSIWPKRSNRAAPILGQAQQWV